MSNMYMSVCLYLTSQAEGSQSNGAGTANQLQTACIHYICLLYVRLPVKRCLSAFSPLNKYKAEESVPAVELKKDDNTEGIWRRNLDSLSLSDNLGKSLQWPLSLVKSMGRWDQHHQRRKRRPGRLSLITFVLSQLQYPLLGLVQGAIPSWPEFITCRLVSGTSCRLPEVSK